MGARGGVVVIALGVMGCFTPRYAGKVSVDGRPFVPRACKVKEGVDLTDAEGRVLRLTFAEKPTEKFPYLPPAKSRPSVVAVKPAGAPAWDVVGPCGPLLVEEAPHKGTFSADMRLGCTSDRHYVEGRLQFENCK